MARNSIDISEAINLPITEEMKKRIDRQADEIEKLKKECERLQREIDYPTCQRICPEIKRLIDACNNIKTSLDKSEDELLQYKRQTETTYLNLSYQKTIGRLKSGKYVLLRDDGVLMISDNLINWEETDLEP